MATLSVQTLTVAGLAPTYASASGGGDKVRPGDHTFIHVKNDGGASVTVTIDDPNSVEPTAATAWNPDAAIVIAPATSKFIGPLVETRFRNSSDSLVHISYSGVSSVTIAAIRV